MAKDVRARMVDGAVLLLAKKGLQATSFSTVIEATGAPRGSLYHHFPGGKDQLVTEAVDLAGERALRVLDEKAGSSPLELTEYFLGMWRLVLTASQFTAGCSVLAVTVATDSPELLDRAAGVFRAWRLKLTALFELGGLTASDSRRFAATLVASSEGAVVLSRAERSMEPFELVAEQMIAEVERLGSPVG